MSPKKKKKKRKQKTRSSGSLSSLRGGFRSVVAGNQQKKESMLSKIITYLLFAALIAFLIYRYTK